MNSLETCDDGRAHVRRTTRRHSACLYPPVKPKFRCICALEMRSGGGIEGSSDKLINTTRRRKRTRLPCVS